VICCSYLVTCIGKKVCWHEGQIIQDKGYPRFSVLYIMRTIDMALLIDGTLTVPIEYHYGQKKGQFNLNHPLKDVASKMPLLFFNRKKARTSQKC
jgi:hypothetical protein